MNLERNLIRNEGCGLKCRIYPIVLVNGYRIRESADSVMLTGHFAAEKNNCARRPREYSFMGGCLESLLMQLQCTQY